MQCPRGCNAYGLNQGAMEIVSDQMRSWYWCLHCGADKDISAKQRSQTHRDFTHLMNERGSENPEQELRIDTVALGYHTSKYG